MSNTAERVNIVDTQVLSHDWYLLKKITFDYHRNNGEWQRQTREVYDRGNGAAILLFNREQRTVVLTRQFRLDDTNLHLERVLVDAIKLIHRTQ